MDLSLWDYAKLIASSAVVGSVISAGINVGYNALRESRETKRERAHAALVAIETLEGFTRACARTIVEAHAAEDEAARYCSHEPLSRINLPKFQYPESIAWKWIEPAIAAQFREFTTHRESSAHYIVGNDEYADPFDTTAEIEVESARLGQKAWKMAERMRDAFGIPKAQLSEHDSDIHKIMADELIAYEKAKKRAEENHAKIWADMQAISSDNKE